MTTLNGVAVFGVIGALASLMIGMAQAANRNRLPDIGDAERIVVPGDGLELAAYLFRPDANTGDRPAIVFLHGSENSPWHTRNIARFFRNQGYVVLAPSQRGGTGSDLGASLACEFKADDIVETIRWLRDQPGVDRDRIGLVGGSMGGIVALLAAAKSDVVSAVFVWSTATDLERWAETYRVQDPGYYGRLSNALKYGCGSSGLNANSPLAHADRISAPVILVHGELDEMSPPDQSRLMFDALIRAGGEAELIVMPEEGHRMSRAAWDEFSPRVLALFEKAFREAPR